MDHSQVHNSIGSVAKAALPREIIYNGGSTSQDDDNNNRSSGRPSYSQNYQQESYRGNGNSRGYYQSESYSEPESEWMQFGPSSQMEFMEFDEEDKDVRV